MQELRENLFEGFLRDKSLHVKVSIEELKNLEFFQFGCKQIYLRPYSFSQEEQGIQTEKIADVSITSEDAVTRK